LTELFGKKGGRFWDSVYTLKVSGEIFV